MSGPHKTGGAVGRGAGTERREGVTKTRLYGGAAKTSDPLTCSTVK